MSEAHAMLGSAGDEGLKKLKNLSIACHLSQMLLDGVFSWGLQLESKNNDSIPLDLDNNTKEKVLHRHNERIAIAFALINMPVAKPITVKKNLRVVGRKIIVRYNSRCHHFEDGLRFCGDYW
ncbi:hypothetical protein HYC85_006876 [Camellia sinensis]|uniref:DYW domain-containing protein n=1 Tax=Camellia sinensis TaxID=4442 RepID=A0A7J7HME4_CAMSI|nr:hypothetical protein HYC85_006876 [Camellia sinensis]